MTWILVAVAVLALHNFLVNELLPDALYIPANALTGAVLVGIAAIAGASPADLGLGGASAWIGLRWGLVIAGLVAIGLAFGAALPAMRVLFHDQRVTGRSGANLAYEALLRIPVGTALFEELAFRGVLLALFLGVTPTLPAVALCSGLFGLWHVLPTVNTLRINDIAPGTTAYVRVVTGAVVVTAIGGAVFCVLRLYTGSLLAPVVAHTATNSLAIVAAFAVQHADGLTRRVADRVRSAG